MKDLLEQAALRIEEFIEVIQGEGASNYYAHGDIVTIEDLQELLNEINKELKHE